MPVKRKDAMRAPNPDSKNVLLVEDDDLQRLYFREELEREGYQVRSAGDGREALKEIAEEKPGVVIMDVVMLKIRLRRAGDGWHPDPFQGQILLPRTPRDITQ